MEETDGMPPLMEETDCMPPLMEGTNGMPPLIERFSTSLLQPLTVDRSHVIMPVMEDNRRRQEPSSFPRHQPIYIPRDQPLHVDFKLPQWLIDAATKVN